MNIRRFVSSAAAAAIAIVLCTASAYATCTPTGYVKDGINQTAAMINPGDLSGPLTVDATGCNIGIFYGPGASGTVDSVTVQNANYYGIVVTGDCGEATCATGAASVDVTNSTIQNIGENPFNGTQHGIGVYYRARAVGSSVTGTISGNSISLYQKGGIVVDGPGAAASISTNTVTGLGPVTYIGQNGIQVSRGATGQVMRNSVTGNSYTGTNNASSAGILVFGGCGSALTTGIQIVKNTVGSTTPADGNDIGVALANYDPSCSTTPSTATNNKVINNIITNAQITNVSGDGYPCGYQAGISDSGVSDKLINNTVAGIGYTRASCSAGAGTDAFAIDTSTATGAKVHANSVP